MMSSEHVIKMPDIGEGIVEVEVVAWRVQAGDQVSEDQILADVMTDKATVEIPSPVKGRVLALGGEVGELMRVGSALIRIEVEGEAGASAPAASAATAPAPAPAPVSAAAAPAPVQAPAPSPTPIAQPAVAAHAPQDLGLSLADKPIASPSLRRRAWELGVDLAQVGGTGLGGRIMQADLDAFVASHGSQLRPPAVAAAPAAPAAAPTSAPRLPRSGSRGDGVEAIRIVGLRRKIAEKMQDAKRRIPHFSYVEEVDVTELEALRLKLNIQYGASRGKLTLLPLLARAIVRTLPDFPQINARLDDEAGVINRFDAVHLGVAAQTPAGLMVPVLRHAESHDLWSCAAEIRRLAEAARSGRATRDELSGSTITISSLGALGGIVTTPVINSPEVAIVGVNRIVERPMIRNGQVVARQMMNLSSSFDHRVVDGQDAAEFIQALRGLMESPALLFID
ncbi:dihydrolipoamide acetyltransferase family protein [Paucibacter sp. DJ2R-2]|uniref:dihydrolipoamide acetyltransferase family protein n=1 Tax=Paucibacter sp. DJ2R-2 TaxID=2893558 RepID=UPI0021E3D7D1|nr:dihydrolipoamide acetyltransferase family protein [Paucibacter sp. DJ2R-2]MCV2423182.1 2-oxo acid dehydrogenase subunit E2 [Paucibacter sp. DJ4R-1]MCV2440638.1 2-oxo acid dehydrogenase subunit E2 [Paucibacter sp. DJ2R-2]